MSWRVERWGRVGGPHDEWWAFNDTSTELLIKTFRPFLTWREAYDYADRMARR